MNPNSDTLSDSMTQYTVFSAIRDLLSVSPVFLLGAVAVAVMLIRIFQKNRTMPKIRISVATGLFYYYLCIMLTNVVGIPTLGEYIRLSGFGETFFHPNLNLIPFQDGFGLSFILNIFLFIPTGFLCPLISRHYRRIKNILLIGCGLSLSIEIVQLFTLYRITDIDDLITNVVGTLVGYGCFRLVHEIASVVSHSARNAEEPYSVRYMPVVVIVISFVLGFFSSI